MHRSERHHHTQRKHIERFARHKSPTGIDLVWVYERGKNEPYCTNPVNAGVETNYYSLTLNSTGDRRNDVERLINEIETRGTPIVEKLVKGENQLSNEERFLFSDYVALMMFRGPKFRQRVDEYVRETDRANLLNLVNDRTRFMRSLERSGLTLNSADMDAYREWLLAENWHIEIDGTYHMHVMFYVIEAASNVIANMVWEILKAPSVEEIGVEFVTSDNPVLITNYTAEKMWIDIPLSTPTAIIDMPLSPEICFRATWYAAYDSEEIIRRTVNESQVIVINAGMAAKCHSAMYSPFKRPYIGNLLKHGQNLFEILSNVVYGVQAASSVASWSS
ncbi:MAG: DUF4238 domain-containing protein, partial [Candidatus Poribacteria bacterium]|nr:DUF4238 domain-containing protein [Candidatus Poribacteria bacterium]